MLTQRTIDVKSDRQVLLDFHCRINYESDSPWARAMPFERYRKLWLASSQPRQFLADLEQTLLDKRTIAEIWEDGGKTVSYVWATFKDSTDYGFTFAEIIDIAVTPEYQDRGIATSILEHIEQLARAKGVVILRSETGIENQISQKLHTDAGFQVYRVGFEKVLKNPIKDLNK